MRTAKALEASDGIRPKIKGSFEFWCRHALAPRGLTPARHHLMLIHFLEDLAFGKFDRGMIHMPPGYAKTEYTSILFPAWFLALDATMCVIAGSNTADLALRNGRKVRNLVTEHQDSLNYTLAADAKASGQWSTSQDGEYFAAGVGGTSVGRRADLFVIDDPFLSRAQVEQELNRKNVVDWYKGTVIGRMKPGGKIVLMHTRWHEEDLAGTLLSEMEKGGDQWQILNLPAIAGENDPMGRKPGEPLWPEWEDLPALQRKKVAVGNREWASQFQQTPAPPEGALFPTNNIRRVKSLPAPIEYVVRAWDFAATDQVGGTNPDWTVGMKLAALTNGEFAVVDITRFQKGPLEMEQLLLETAKSDGEDMQIVMPQDPAQAGKFQAAYFVSKLAGYLAEAVLMTGSKTTRAGPVVAQVEAGNLIVLDRWWTDDFISELKTFPAGSKDDQVDALSLGFMKLVELVGSDGIIKYYEQALINSKEVSRTLPGSNMADFTLVDVYKEAYEKLMGKNEDVCGRCKMPLGNSRVTDGDTSWHPQCFS